MKRLLIILGLLICVALAQTEKKQEFKPTDQQAEHLLRLQVEAREALANVQLAQQQVKNAQELFNNRMQAFQAACAEVAAANKWPADVTCSAKTGQQIQDVLVAPVTFAVPQKPKEAKK